MNMSEIFEACQYAKRELWLWRSPMSTLAHLSQWTLPPDVRDDDEDVRETAVPVRTSTAVYLPDPRLSIMWGLHLESWVQKERKHRPVWSPEPMPFLLPYESDGAAILLNGVPIWEVDTATVRQWQRGHAVLARPREHFLGERKRPWVMTWEVEFARLISDLSSGTLHEEIWAALVGADLFDVRDTDPIRDHGTYL